MKPLISSTVLAVALAVVPVTTLARGAGGNPGGASASHISSQGRANTNGPNAADRDKGLARAEDRMSAKGLAHQKATNHAKGKGKKKGTASG
jgi:hypothetical protein